MKFENIPKELQEPIKDLRHGSLTIQSDVDDAIDQEENWKEAKSTISVRMIDLIGEAKSVLKDICGEEV